MAHRFLSVETEQTEPPNIELIGDSADQPGVMNGSPMALYL